MSDTWFDILGILPTEDDRQIHEAYRQKKVEFQGDSERLSLINKAYQALSNPISRKRYLQSIEGKVASRKPDTRGDQTLIQPIRSTTPPQPPPPPPTSKRQKTELFELEPKEPIKNTSSVEVTGSHSARRKTELFEDPKEGELTRSFPVHKPDKQDGQQPANVVEPVEKPEAGTPLVSKGRSVRKPTVFEPQQKETIPPPCIHFSYQGLNVTYPLKEGQNLIGRPPRKPEDKCPDILIPDPDQQYVSRKHALILVNGSLCTVQDLQSKNGTSLNGHRLEPSASHPLKDGDVIEIEGRRLRVQLQ